MDKKAFVRLYSLSKKQIPLISVLCIIGVLVSVCAIRFSIASKNVVDAAAQGTNVLQAVIPLAVLLISQLLLNISYSVIYTVAHGKMLMHMRADYFHSSLRKDYLSISAYHSGELVNRINGDTSVVCNAVFDILPTAFTIVTRIIFGFITLYSLDKTFAFFCLALGPVILLTASVYRKRMKALHKESRKYDGLLKSFMQESARNIPIIKCFRAETHITKHSEELQNKLYDISIKRNIISVIATIFYFIALTSGYYIALAWGAYKLSLGLMSFGTLVAITDLAGQITAPFKNLSSLLPQYYSMSASMERLSELDGIVTESSEVKFLPEPKSINIENLIFSYGGTPVLDGFNLKINQGEMVALCGESGIGKSTLLHLLTGVLHPKSGRIYVKTTDGEFDLDETTRTVFSYVPQTSMLISGTIAQNICFTQPVDEDKMLACAEMACIKDFILSLPDGANTVLGEEGGGLSGGQIQRLAIARALYCKTDVLLLDEATSAIDEETEQKVLSNIRKLGTTCIVVTHRSTAISICDKSYYI